MKGQGYSKCKHADFGLLSLQLELPRLLRFFSRCRGTDELLGVMDQVTIINSTLGKALGGAAGASFSYGF